MRTINAIRMGGGDVLPLVEGGKGVSISNGLSAGNWALAGGVGTFSAVNADSFDVDGRPIPQVYHGRTRRERHEELVQYAVQGALTQARRAWEITGGKGRIHANILWEMGGAERIITEVLEQAKGIINGITCGAGMPYRLSDIAARFNIYYYPIVSSARAFNALWKRAYCKAASLLGGVVYEDPWLAGGHNGLSNSEDPTKPEAPFPRVVALRKLMRSVGLDQVPIVMAGGVWRLDEWKDWIGNKDLGPIAFQFGTRPLLTQESPIPEGWKRRLLELLPGDVLLQRFSPTGFYSSAVRHRFLDELVERSGRQVEFREAPEPGFETFFAYGRSGHGVYLSASDHARVDGWLGEGFNPPLTPADGSLIFVRPEKAREIRRDQANCMGCLSHCKFSNWKDHGDHTTGRPADPRSFCIQKTLMDIAHGHGDFSEEQLMFAGHNVFRFRQDPFYANGFVPSVKQLVQRVLTGH